MTQVYPRIPGWSKLSKEEKGKVFNSLTTKERAPFNAAAKASNNNRLIKVIAALNKGVCIFCRFKGDFLQEYDGENPLSVIKPAYFLHVQTSHGYTPEIFIDMLLMNYRPTKKGFKLSRGSQDKINLKI